MSKHQCIKMIQNKLASNALQVNLKMVSKTDTINWKYDHLGLGLINEDSFTRSMADCSMVPCMTAWARSLFNRQCFLRHIAGSSKC